MIHHHLLILDIQPFKQYIPFPHDELVARAFDTYLAFLVNTLFQVESDIGLLINEIQQQPYIDNKVQDVILPHLPRWEFILSSTTPQLIEIIEIIDIYYQRTLRCALRSLLGNQKPTALRYNTITTVIILDVYHQHEE